MIIDSHVHLGEDYVFDEVNTEDELTKYYDEFNIDGGIIQPFLPRPYIEDHQEIHNRIAAYCKKMRPRKKFWGMASINPHFRPEDYDKEAERCIKELGFVAIKITTIGHACHPSSKDAYHVYEVCEALKVPLMIHTGNGVPFADPISVYWGAKDHPDVPVILAHAGSETFNQQARLLAEKLDNVYLEPSWCGTNAVKKMIASVGCSKILFSSDNLDQIPVELAKYRQIIKNEDDLEKVMWKNANDIFKLNL
ncbi:amidohydrolase family protein [Porcincola intestinalis]|uniref:amidohydrolase family protein n=1 Tax=Porcincola intestinalis TaxID=2606632 RepID=UPI002A91D81E|nr:amidohydrolase family protein [Porcincola intestinalis]MDY5579264.1 amidohydrolase family protein [Porcincola intestinalis]